ncbi:response regulator [bacterium]|nr:response regulator [bacterium]
MNRMHYQDWARRNRLLWYGQGLMMALLMMITPIGRHHPATGSLLTALTIALGYVRVRESVLILTDRSASWLRYRVMMAVASGGQALTWGTVACLALTCHDHGHALAVVVVFMMTILAGVSFTHTPAISEFDRSLWLTITPPLIVALLEPGARPISYALLTTGALAMGMTRYQHRIWRERIEGHERDRERVAELERAQAEAAEAQETRARFLANISHELRTPLNGIIGLTDLALQEPVNETTRQNLEMVGGSGRHMLMLVDDLLDYTKIEHGQFDLVNRPFSLRQALGDVAGQLRPLAGERDLELIADVDPTLPDGFVGDAHRLSQVILNLGSNAIKFTDEGSVTVRCRPRRCAGDRVMLHVTVQDTGIGIPEDQYQVIFEAFRQVDDSNARRHGGTGLGLAICSYLVKRMGGEIWVESWPGHGSAFHFTVILWPHATPDASDPAAADATHDTARVRPPRRRVLVAEDNRINQQLMLRLLDKLGQDVDLAVNGVEAVAACRRQRYDLVLMDLQMPEMDGLEATRQIRIDDGDHHTPIIALTANAMSSDRDRCLAAGMDDFLAKPVKSQTLSDLLHHLDRPALV